MFAPAARIFRAQSSQPFTFAQFHFLSSTQFIAPQSALHGRLRLFFERTITKSWIRSLDLIKCDASHHGACSDHHTA